MWPILDEGPAAEDVNEYENDTDYKDIAWLKDHSDGRKTKVAIDLRLSPISARVMDTAPPDRRGAEEIGHILIGHFDGREAAVEAAVEWMRANPDGVCS